MGIYDFDYPEDLQHAQEEMDEARRADRARMHVIPWLLGAVAVFAAAAAYGAWTAA